MQRLRTLLAVTILCLGWSTLSRAGEDIADRYETEFKAAIKTALEQKDREAIARLSYWEGVDDEQRKLQEKRQETMFDRPVLRVELRPKPLGYRSEYISRGARYRVNLPVDGLVRIEFEGPVDSGQVRLFPFGKHEGRYYIGRMSKVETVRVMRKKKQLLVGVTVPSGPKPVDYTVSCSYDADGQEKKEKFDASRATQKVLWGQKINWCRVWNRSEDGWVRLVLKENLETFYESSQVDPGRSAAYP